MTTALAMALLTGTRLGTFPVWVEFPQPAMAQDLPLDGDAGVLARTAYEYASGPTLYRLDIISFAPAYLENVRDEEILDRARDGAQTMTKFVVANHKYIRRDGFSGRQFDIQVERGPVIRHLILLRRPLLVHALVVTPTENVDSPAVTRFFDSVRLQPPVPGAR
jgi:hypothetical protein